MRRRAALLMILVPLFGACTSTSPSPPQASAPSGPPPITGWLAGPAGQQLDEAERERAFAAEIATAESGRRTSWRGARGNFGVVEAGQESANCRSVAHTIYIDGRAQRGGSTACRSPSGTWQISG